jgi:cell division septation protein DedD
LTSHTPDDGFHEIQLNGKQLVFLFMAATVVSVVIFLSGVLVGRGVRAERGAEADAAALAEQPTVDATTATAGAATSGSDLRAAAPPAGADELTYFNRLEKAQPVVEELKPVPPSAPALADAAAAAPPSAAPVSPPPAPKPASVPASTSPPARSPASAAAAAPARTPAAVPASAASTRGAYVVQVAALNSRAEADAMVKQLSGKGYEAYVQAPVQGGPSIFRVRIGNFPTRREAETLAAKIQQEGQFKPWVAPR